MTQFQLVVRRPDKTTGELGKWEFVAHGARYFGAEMDSTVRQLTANGCAVQALKL